MKPIILLIDDDRDFLDEITLLLSSDFECVTASNEKEGIEKAQIVQPDAVLLDLMLGDDNGIETLKKIKHADKDMPVIMITEYASVDTAVKAMRLGAHNYVPKTPNIEELKIIIERAMLEKLNRNKTKLLEEELNKTYGKIIGKSDAIEDVKEKIKLIASNYHTVLITGESGVGKELAARRIHELSDRSGELFLAVNCAAIPAPLIESELFGYEKGSFTGAEKRKLGKFEAASAGTIFLDEIGELKPDAQVKLMRVIQEKEFQRVGGNKTLRTDARIIAATNKNLFACVNDGTFREDLYYRLDVFPIEIPPLRKRREDIPLLLDYFAEKISREMNLRRPVFTKESVAYFTSYDWPGNIRELRNYVTRAIILSAGKEVTPEFLSRPLLSSGNEIESLTNDVPLKWEDMDKLRKSAAEKASRKVEAEFAKKLLEKFNGNISKAAEYAGMNRTNLHKLIKRAGV
ncbi:MAG: sigma-54-dependent Fis family transcriptional regulator [Chlorobi bacterium]|nr:sigma-54-dependent Fis family transcriptional regulator [Chlorobiota bacterium]